MQFLFSGTEFECMRFQGFHRFPTAGSTGSTPGSMVSHSADWQTVEMCWARLGTPPRQSGWWELWPQLSRAVLRCFLLLFPLLPKPAPFQISMWHVPVCWPCQMQVCQRSGWEPVRDYSTCKQGARDTERERERETDGQTDRDRQRQ